MPGHTDAQFSLPDVVFHPATAIEADDRAALVPLQRSYRYWYRNFVLLDGAEHPV